MASNHFTISFVTTSKGAGIDSYVVEKNLGGNTGWTKVNTEVEFDEDLRLD